MQRARILIVEDEGIVAMELSQRVLAMGHEVVAAVASAADAVAVAERGPIDLALLDVRLRGPVSGTELGLRLRERYGVPAVFLTAYSDDDTLDQVKRCEPLGYLLKPFDDRVLRVTLETALHVRRLALERAEAERLTRRISAQYAAILEYSHDAIISVDETQAIRLFNHGAERMFEYAAEEVLGRPIDLLLASEVTSAHRTYVDGFRASGTTARKMSEAREVHGRRKSGAAFPAEVSISRLELEGEVLLTAFVRDITTRRVLEQKSAQSERMEGLGRLAGGIAHDFNNVLTAVLGYARLLQRSMPADDRRLADVREIQQAGERAAGLIRQLLAYAGRQVLRPAPSDINAIVRGLERLLHQFIGEHVTLEVVLSEGLLPVIADPVQIEQVVMNLVLNARDALHGGGRIIVSTGMLDQAQSVLHGREGAPQTWVVISVSDDGVGMDAATVQRIFEPFFTTKGQLGGTGLGLATSYGVIRQSGGDISVHSRPGEGSRFDVLLPAVVGAATDAQAGAAMARGARGSITPGAPGRVWLLDDDAMVRELGARLLEDAGHSVVVLAQAHEVLTRLASGEAAPDVLVSDVVMPGMSGFELARRVRELCPQLSVLLMSAYNAEFIDRLGARDPSFPLIEKPFDPDAFVREVGRLITSPG